MADETTSFSDLLKIAKANGYRQLDIAEELGASRARVSMWAKGHFNPNRFYQALFPALIEKFQANPRVKEPKK